MTIIPFFWTFAYPLAMRPTNSFKKAILKRILQRHVPTPSLCTMLLVFITIELFPSTASRPSHYFPCTLLSHKQSIYHRTVGLCNGFSQAVVTMLVYTDFAQTTECVSFSCYQIRKIFNCHTHDLNFWSLDHITEKGPSKYSKLISCL